MQTQTTQVGIVGAGPAGLLLAHLLHLRGIESVVLEARSREYVEKRVRAGVLEQGTVDTLNAAGVGDRMRREGLVHHGIELRYGGASHRIAFEKLVPDRAITVYGQQEVVRDLIAARLAAKQPIRFEVDDVAVHDIHSAAPFITYGGGQRIDCDFIAGCDGFHGVTRPSIPDGVITTYEREYPFAWLGVLARVAPSAEELIYARTERGFALHSMRSPEICRFYLQVAPDEDIAAWPDDRIWAELKARLETVPGFELATGPVLEKGITPMRSFVAEPMQYGRLYLAGDAAHIVPPTGAKGLNLAVADVRLLTEALAAWYSGRGESAAEGNSAKNAESLLNAYSETCLRRVWRAQHFSWWMTTLLHTFASEDPYGRRLQLSYLDYVTSSEAAATTLAENYVGMPLDWGDKPRNIRTNQRACTSYGCGGWCAAGGCHSRTTPSAEGEISSPHIDHLRELPCIYVVAAGVGESTVVAAQRRWLAAVMGAVALLPFAAACSGVTSASTKKTQDVPAAAVSVMPANGTTNVVPEDGVKVSSSGGQLVSVSVSSGTDADDGTFATGNTAWQTNWALKPGATYTVTAVAKNKAGKSTTSTTTFTTKKPSSNHLEISDVTPNRGETVGVGMFIDVTFNHDVSAAHKASVERALQVESGSPVVGAWHWVTDDEVQFRPKEYWPAHQTVRLVAHLTGVQAAPGVTGVSNYQQQFKIGDSQVVKVNLTTHMARFYINGNLARTVPVSGGACGTDGYGNNLCTQEGTLLIMQKQFVVDMVSPNIQPGQSGYYNELVYYTTQITDSGEYLHQNPEDPGCLGHENCSHGCVRMQPAGAQWWYHVALIGSPVTITQKGSPRPPLLGNGWTQWDESWTQWLKDSHAGPVTTSSLSGALPANTTNAPTATLPSAAATPTTAG